MANKKIPGTQWFSAAEARVTGQGANPQQVPKGIPGDRKPAADIRCVTSYFLTIQFEVPNRTVNWKVEHQILEQVEHLAGEMDLDDYKMVGAIAEHGALITANHTDVCVLGKYKDQVLKLIEDRLAALENTDGKA